MAIQKCAECGGQVSTSAEKCPHCGAKQPKKTSVFTWIAGAGFAIVIAQCSIAMNKSDEEREQAQAAEQKRVASLSPAQRAAEAERKKLDGQMSAAAYACRELVTRRLKDPESAKWETPWRTGVTISENNTRFRLQVTARAKNSFGAYGQHVFDCDLRVSGDNWFPIAIKELRN